MWATRTFAQAATATGIVIEADIHFQKEENTREYNKYLLTCIAAVNKNADSDLASSNSDLASSNSDLASSNSDLASSKSDLA
jgi:hypothetical protein